MNTSNIPCLQVVTKLFHIVEPDVACFGQKDYQQWRLITRMVSNGGGWGGREAAAGAVCVCAADTCNWLGLQGKVRHKLHVNLHADALSCCCMQVRDLDFPITIIGVPIARERDGLAMSRSE